jgi:hypothetical protein
METLLTFVLLVGVTYYIFRPKPNPIPGALETSTGRTYPYILGNRLDLHGRSGEFNGIDIALPKEMPHIYLDSLKGGGRQLNFIIDKSQKIALEGNFYRSYQVFVPRKYESIALSILTPDVMQTLQQYAGQFDVEIYGSFLRVITNKRVLKNAEIQGKLLIAASQVLEEIDHRLQSWTQTNSLAAIDQDLLIYPYRGFRLFGRSFTYDAFFVSVYWSMISVCVFLATWATLGDGCGWLF